MRYFTINIRIRINIFLFLFRVFGFNIFQLIIVDFQCINPLLPSYPLVRLDMVLFLHPTFCKFFYLELVSLDIHSQA